MKTINELPQNVINQIAAGEVVDRPSAVLKELVENAIDAGAKKVTVKVRNGGISLLEVVDDGSGMSAEDIIVAADAHATSKISTLDDIVSIATFGFRGEALSSVAAVSHLTLISSDNDSGKANELHIDGGVKSKLKSVSRDRGTTVRVEDLFFNVPARQKFLKTPQTEYRKLIETFIPIALINPQVHFVFQNDGKTTYNLPAVGEATPGSIHPQRLSDLIKRLEFIDTFYDGEGIMVGGVVAHPRYHGAKVATQYIFVNSRPIWDAGIARAVLAGTSRFIPDGHKVPFAIAISIKPELVDVNVHPRKLEVRFSNPYRIYTAIEQAIRTAFEQTLNKATQDEKDYDRFRSARHQSDNSNSNLASIHSKNYEVEQSLRFSRMLLRDSTNESAEAMEQRFNENEQKEIEMDVDTSEKPIKARQFLGRYIVTEVGNTLWIVDQHAAAERIRFEKLLDEISKRSVAQQNLLVPIDISLDKHDMEFVKEHKEIVELLGFGIELNEDEIGITSVPALLVSAKIEELFGAVLNELREFEEFETKEGQLNEKFRNAIVATMACHSSLRMNQGIGDNEAATLVSNLIKCKNSYSCPHGRPIVWRISRDEIDQKFER